MGWWRWDLHEVSQELGPFQGQLCLFCDFAVSWPFQLQVGDLYKNGMTIRNFEGCRRASCGENPVWSGVAFGLPRGK